MYYSAINYWATRDPRSYEDPRKLGRNSDPDAKVVSGPEWGVGVRSAPASRRKHPDFCPVRQNIRFFSQFPHFFSSGAHQLSLRCPVWHLGPPPKWPIFVRSGPKSRGLRPLLCPVQDLGSPPVFGGPVIREVFEGHVCIQ